MCIHISVQNREEKLPHLLASSREEEYGTLAFPLHKSWNVSVSCSINWRWESYRIGQDCSKDDIVVFQGSEFLRKQLRFSTRVSPVAESQRSMSTVAGLARLDL